MVLVGEEVWLDSGGVGGGWSWGMFTLPLPLLSLAGSELAHPVFAREVLPSCSKSLHEQISKRVDILAQEQTRALAPVPRCEVLTWS